MEAALNQEELQQELHSEEEACSGILPQEFAIEQEQGPFLDAQEDCLAMLDEEAQEATPSEPTVTQDLRLDDTTSSPPITRGEVGHVSWACPGHILPLGHVS